MEGTETPLKWRKKMTPEVKKFYLMTLDPVHIKMRRTDGPLWGGYLSYLLYIRCYKG